MLFASRKPVSAQHFSNILVINLMGLGNMIFSLPLLKTLRKNYPKARITLLASYKPVAELISIEKNLVDDIVFFNTSDYKGLRKKIRFMRSLGKRNFDLSVLTYPSGKFSGVAAFFIGAKKRLALEQKVGGFRTGVFSNIITKSEGKHCVDSNLDMLKSLGITNFDRSISIKLPDASVTQARQILEEHGLKKGQKLIGIHTGAVQETWYKQWTAHGFAIACSALVRRHNAKILIIGGPEELHTGRSIHAMMREKPIMFFNKTIPETAALIKNCDVFISTDTGPGHLASALGVPVVSIFGPTDSEKARPYGREVIVVKSDRDCIPCIDSFTANYFKCRSRECLRGLEPKKVIEAAEKLLNPGRRGGGCRGTDTDY